MKPLSNNPKPTDAIIETILNDKKKGKSKKGKTTVTILMHRVQ